MLIQADIMPDRRHCFIFFMICFVIFLGLGYFSLSTVSFAFISITYLMLCMKRLLYMSLKSIIPVCLCLFSYSLEACWNSNFRASRGTKISKTSWSGGKGEGGGWGLQRPQTQREGQGLSKLRSREANFFMQPCLFLCFVPIGY